MRVVYTVHIVADHFYSAAKLVRKCFAVKDSSKLSEHWGEQISGKAIERGALGSKCDLELRGSTVVWTLSTWSTHPSASTASVAFCKL